MRRAFVHEAAVGLAPDADLQAPGAAITAALCGHSEHPPPCPLAAHHTAAERAGDEACLRTLFATEPDLEQLVRQRIAGALAEGRWSGPDGTLSRWHLLHSGAGTVRADETDHAQRLVRG